MPKPAITTFSSVSVTPSPTNKDNGLYAPELTQEQIDAIPLDTLRNGAIVYNTTDNVFQFYEDGDWENINTGLGDVEGPNASVDNNIAIFNGNTGKIIQDSGVSINQVPVVPVPIAPLFRSFQSSSSALVAAVNEIGNLGHIKFVNGLGIIFVDALMPVEFINNDFGPDSQVCSLFTGGLPSASSSPSALVELQTSTGALLLSRLTQTEITALLPIQGMIVYNTDTQNLVVYNGIGWSRIFTGGANLDLAGFKIINLGAPTLTTDAATKGYVDTAISGASITLTGAVTGTGAGTINTILTPITTSQITNFNSAVTAFRLDQFAIPTASINLNSQKIINLLNPTNAQDAATKGYVDTAISGIPSSITLTGAVTGTGAGTINTTLTPITTSQITNFNSAVTAFRLDQFAIPTASINLNSQKIINLLNPTNAQDAATKGYVDTAISGIPSSITLTGAVTGTGSTGSSVSTSAPAKYIIQTSNASVPNAQILASLTTGLLKNTTATGVLSTGVAGIDYYSPGNPTYLIDTSGTTFNFFAGTNAGVSTVGTNNVGVGFQALFTNTTGNSNLAVGNSSLYNNTTGFENLAVGFQALNSNTIGNQNLAVGFQALFTNTTGSANLAVGRQALRNNTTGSVNLAVGESALFSNTTGSTNLAFGVQALRNNTIGIQNLAIGFQALNSNTTGSTNLAVGESTLFTNTTGIQNLAIGLQALFTNTTGSTNLAVGNSSLYNNTTGIQNLAVGFQALNSNTIGSTNLAVGNSSLYNNTTGGLNLAIGFQALFTNTTGNSNLAIGVQALRNNTTGNQNLAIGTALSSNTTGIQNLAIGLQALNSNTIGSTNLAVGFQVLFSNTTGNSNLAFGNSSLFSNTTGNSNLAFGENALFSNTTGSANLAVGRQALNSNTTGSTNLAVGFQVLFSNTTGNSNLAFGNSSLFSNTTGNSNLAFGESALFSNTTGSNNTVMGYSAGSSFAVYNSCVLIGANANTGSSGLTNAIAIGTSAVVASSNSLVLGNGCNVGIGTSAPDAPLQFATTTVNRKIVLWANVNNDHQFYGFGVNGATLRYQVNTTTSSHVFYAGTSTTTSNEVGRITGTGDFVSPSTIYGRRAGGLMYATSMPPFIPVPLTPTKIPGATISSLLNQFTMPIANRLQYIGTIAIVANININLTVRTTTNTTTTFVVSIAKGGLIIGQTQMYAASTISNIPLNLTTSMFVSMATNEYIEAFVQSSNNSQIDIPALIVSIVAV